MSTETKLRRGTAAQCAAGTPAEGELWVDLTNDRVRLGDGTVAGGFSIPNAVDVQKGSFNTVNATGTNTLTVTLDPAPASYFSPMVITFKAAATNTTGVTLDVNGLGAKNIYKASSGALGALAAGDLTIGAYYTVRYDGTQFVLEAGGGGGGVASVTGSAGIVVTPTTGAVGVSIDTNNALGVGSYALCGPNGGGSIANNSTIAGSSLLIANMGNTGVTSSGVTLSGTWRNVSGISVSLSPLTFGLFIRIA